jgi:hypothetical protein
MSSGSPSSEVLTVTAEDGQYLLEASALRVNAWPTPVGALLTGEENWTAVITGTQFGPFSVRIELLGEPPVRVDNHWDMTAERDIVAPEGKLVLHDLYDTEPAYRLAVPPGRLRMRVHVRDRSAAADRGELPEAAVEAHLILLWPTPIEAVPAVLTGPDAYARTYS